MKTLIDVARRLEGMAQNAADVKELHGQHTQEGKRSAYLMVEYLKMAEIIHNHIAQCKQSQSL